RAAHFIRAGHHGRLSHRIVLEQGALHLERTDTVTGTDDHVVGTPDKPEITIGVLPAAIPGDVPLTLEGLRSFVQIFPVFPEQSNGTLGLHPYGNISLLPWRQHRPAMRLDDGHIKAGHWLTHGAWLYLQTRVIGHQKRRFG